MKIETPSGKLLFEHKSNFVLEKKGEIYRFHSFEFNEQLKVYLAAFESFRKDQTKDQLTPAEFDGLPFNQNNRMWEERIKDLSFILKHIKSNSEILEVGAWNSWLTQHLSEKNSVTAIDFFTNELDGLGAIKHYSEGNWTPIQTSPQHIDLMQSEFDFIVFNRGIQYYSDVPKLIEICKSKIKKGGSIIITGLNIKSKTKNSIDYYNETAEAFEIKYGTSFYLTEPFRKVLSYPDLKFFQTEGFQLYPQTAKITQVLNRTVFKNKSSLYHIIWTNK